MPPVLVLHPYVYAEMLAAKLEQDFFNGKEPNRGINPDEAVAYGSPPLASVLGNRCSLRNTRQLIDAIHDGSLVIVEWEVMPVLGPLQTKSGIKDVPKEILRPQEA